MKKWRGTNFENLSKQNEAEHKRLNLLLFLFLSSTGCSRSDHHCGSQRHVQTSNAAQTPLARLDLRLRKFLKFFEVKIILLLDVLDPKLRFDQLGLTIFKKKSSTRLLSASFENGFLRKLDNVRYVIQYLFIAYNSSHEFYASGDRKQSVSLLQYVGS